MGEKALPLHQSDTHSIKYSIITITDRSKLLQILANEKRSKLYNVYGELSVCQECNQPPWLNIARTTAIKRLHPVSKGTHGSVGIRYDHICIKESVM
jgi:hypothetical protein